MFATTTAVAVVRDKRGGGMRQAFMREITALAGELRDDAGLDVIILTGAPGWFSAGADLKDEERWGPSEASFVEQREMGRAGFRMAGAWEQLPQITIAALQGHLQAKRQLRKVASATYMVSLLDSL